MSEVTLPEVEETLPGTEDEVTSAEVAPLTSEENTETETEEQKDEPEVQPDEHKKPTGFQKRVQKFQAQLSAKEQELEYWKSVALKQKAEPAPEQVQQKPRLEDFGSVEEYVEAREVFLKEELKREMQQETARSAKHQTVASRYEQKVSEVQKELPDWGDVMAMAAEEPAAPETVQFCMESDAGPLIAYHLAKNPEENERINALSPLRRVAELGKLEDRLTKKAPPKVTQAPSKMTEVKGQGTPVKKTSGEATSYSEWKALREKSGKK